MYGSRSVRVSLSNYSKVIGPFSLFHFFIISPENFRSPAIIGHERFTPNFVLRFFRRVGWIWLPLMLKLKKISSCKNSFGWWFIIESDWKSRMGYDQVSVHCVTKFLAIEWRLWRRPCCSVGSLPTWVWIVNRALRLLPQKERNLCGNSFLYFLSDRQKKKKKTTVTLSRGKAK